MKLCGLWFILMKIMYFGGIMKIVLLVLWFILWLHFIMAFATVIFTFLEVFFNFDDFLCWNDKDRNFEFGLVVQNLN